ncbi:ABC transporter substrate-binding protein [Actinophytocola sp.]|uniref:ABC transporter substrate-binding protein n=1 Tax=Actinophytocola sp. TaxID=1872138 RepID=UPI003D6AC170
MAAACTSAPTSSGGSGEDIEATAAAGIRPVDDVPADVPQDVVDAARDEVAADPSPFVYYEGNPEDQIAKVFAAFKAEYPFVSELTHVRLAVRDLAPRIDQESRAGARTADVALLADDGAQELDSRGQLLHMDWEAAGIAPGLVTTPYAVVTTAGVFTFISNRNELPSPPKSWDDWLDGDLAGKVTLWSQAVPFAALVPVWGVEKTQDYVRDLVAEVHPTLSDTPWVPAQNVAAAEGALTINAYHTALPAVNSGAPIEVVLPDPTPVSLVYASVPKAAKHPKVAQLFIAWLNTQSGAKAYEDATGRGNPLIPTTDTAEMLRGHTISAWTPQEAKKLGQNIVDLTAILRGGGV